MASFDDIWDDDDLWLPQKNKDAATQADKYNLNEYFKDMKLPESAGTLSRKIAKMQQRRAAKRQGLTTVDEEDKSSSSTPPIHPPKEDMGSVLSSPPVTGWDMPKTPIGMTSTPRMATTPEPAFDFLSPINGHQRNQEEERDDSDPEEEFEDAQEYFCEEALEKISMSASFSTIEALLTGNAPEDDGQSCIRAPMTQSLLEVEEESRLEITPPRNTRASSVSPRQPVTSTPLTSRPAPVPKTNSSTTAEKTTPAKSPAMETSRTSHYTPPSSMRNTLTLHADLATLDDLTRRQEEMLRQEVLQQQQQAERKNSWQGGDGSLSSPNSSVGSLASSHSLDIGALKKTLPTPPSRLRAPSKLPRPSGLVAPSSRVSTGTRPRASMEKSGNAADDDCF